jgi:hypothetical protein
MGGRRFRFLEQVHVRGINRRGLRLELVAGLVIALAVTVLPVATAGAQGTSTTTAMTAQSSQVTQHGESVACSLSTLAVSVTGPTGSTVVPSGTVSIYDGAVNSSDQLASATLNDSGKATFSFALENGAHSLSAVYAGDSTFSGSTSTASTVTVSSQCDSTFVVTVSDPAPATSGTMTLTPGQAGTATVTVTPLQSSVPSTAPLFVTISCSGLSDMATCNFTPENVEIVASQYAGVTSDMVIQTYAASSTSLKTAPKSGTSSAPIAWALLLPGAFGLGGLAWGARRRRFLSRLLLVALVGLVTLLGTTGCNPNYKYEHHGPVANPATPAGNYTVLVTAQSSNGTTAITHSTTLALTVN